MNVIKITKDYYLIFLNGSLFVKINRKNNIEAIKKMFNIDSIEVIEN